METVVVAFEKLDYVNQYKRALLGPITFKEGKKTVRIVIHDDPRQYQSAYGLAPANYDILIKSEESLNEDLEANTFRLRYIDKVEQQAIIKAMGYDVPRYTGKLVLTENFNLDLSEWKDVQTLILKPLMGARGIGQVRFPARINPIALISVIADSHDVRNLIKRFKEIDAGIEYSMGTNAGDEVLTDDSEGYKQLCQAFMLQEYIDTPDVMELRLIVDWFGKVSYVQKRSRRLVNGTEDFYQANGASIWNVEPVTESEQKTINAFVKDFEQKNAKAKVKITNSSMDGFIENPGTDKEVFRVMEFSRQWTILGMTPEQSATIAKDFIINLVKSFRPKVTK